MGFFSALMPRETRFFTLFNRHAEYVVQGGRLVADLMHEVADERRRRRGRPRGARIGP